MRHCFGRLLNCCSVGLWAAIRICPLKDDLVGCRWSKGALKFALDTPLPRALLEKLIDARRRELGLV